MAAPRTFTTTLPDASATEEMARRLAPDVQPGDVIALSGPIGAGKSVFARALIRSRLAALGRDEDVPSPSFTLVQTYDAGPVEIWHCDLYRLTTPDEVLELGLEDAFDSAVCLVEWPDRLEGALPDRALGLELVPAAEGDLRHATFCWSDPRWTARLPLLEDTADAQ